jgi:hypothetical protein
LAQSRDATNRQSPSHRRPHYCGSCGVEIYNWHRTHASISGKLQVLQQVADLRQAGIERDQNPGIAEEAVVLTGKNSLGNFAVGDLT